MKSGLVNVCCNGHIVISVVYLLLVKAEENPSKAPDMASATQVASSKCFSMRQECTR